MAKKWWVLASMVMVMSLALGIILDPLNVRAQNGSDPEFTWAGENPAPEFPAGLTWLNVPEPLTLADLQGKIVLLDFWTYGCINCMHVIPDLKRIEAEFADQVVVIGVHSAKFDNEAVSSNILQIVQRYEVVHPIVNDADFQIWQSYGVRAWPTLAIIDPLGRVLPQVHEGEGVYEVVAPVLRTMVEEYSAANLIDPTPITLTPEIDKLSDTPLRFPGKVLVDLPGNRLFIADSGHHRIVVVALDSYEVQHVIGSGVAGLADGDYLTAQFNGPQGLELVGNLLYVADTNNHAIRAIDLATQSVTRVAGTGAMATWLIPSGDALALDLRSPWDVVELNGILYLAMAGSHQIFALNLADNQLTPFAGDAREDLLDGPRLSARLAQPSGITTDGSFLYFADSEASAIRRISFGDEGRVETLIGPVSAMSGRLFIFGDVDGGIEVARLQHPLGVTLGENGLLYITDTYNSKIKVIDPQAKTSQSLSGQVAGGYQDGNLAEALYDEPGGISFGNGKLYVADTNNHVIRVIDLASDSVITVNFPNVALLLPSGDASTAPPLLEFPDSDEPLVLPLQQVTPGSGVILVDAIMPFGYKLNNQAPFTVIWPEDPIVSVQADQRNYQVLVPELPIEFVATFSEGETELTFEMVIYWCEAINEALCFVERRTVIMPVQVTLEVESFVLQVSYNLVPPTSGGGF